MPDRQSGRPKPGARPGAKPGATREQTERRKRFERARRDTLRPDDEEIVVLYGLHAVKAALANPARRIRKLLATENAARRLAEDGVTASIAPEIVRPGAIDGRLLPDAVHQGLYAEVDPLPSPSIEQLAAEGVVLVLDQITDPHNVGAIFRSAAAFGATAIVTTREAQPRRHRRAGEICLWRIGVGAAHHRAEFGPRARGAEGTRVSGRGPRLLRRQRPRDVEAHAAARAGARR